MNAPSAPRRTDCRRASSSSSRSTRHAPSKSRTSTRPLPSSPILGGNYGITPGTLGEHPMAFYPHGDSEYETCSCDVAFPKSLGFQSGRLDDRWPSTGFCSDPFDQSLERDCLRLETERRSCPKTGGLSLPFFGFTQNVTVGPIEIPAMFIGPANIPEAADYGQHHRHLPHSHQHRHPDDPVVQCSADDAREGVLRDIVR